MAEESAKQLVEGEATRSAGDVPEKSIEIRADTHETAAGIEPLPSPPASPSRAKMAAASTREGHHENLRAYESRRRLAYAAKLESCTLYWKSVRDLLAASIQETARAQRLVLGTSRAHQLYSDAMHAMYEDVFLDDKGNVMLKPKQKQKLATTRKKPVRRADGTKPSVLTSVRDAQLTVAERFGENARNMDTEIADEIGRLLENLKKMFAEMEALGNSILNELEKTELEVSSAWGTSREAQERNDV